MSRYLNSGQNRFDNYRELNSRFDSIAECGHQIKRGDRIGWHRKHGAQCAACWAKWSAENAEASTYENSLPESMSENY